MALPPSGIVTVRLAARDADDIDALVASGAFTSRSDFLRYAVKSTVAALRADAARAADDEKSLLEGPGALGTPNDPARGRAASGATKRRMPR